MEEVERGMIDGVVRGAEGSTTILPGVPGWSTMGS